MKKLFPVLTLLVLLAACKKNPCSDVNCQNGGTCNNGTCACATGYSGANCQTAANASFVGTYAGAWTCSTNASVSLVAGTGAGNTILIEDPEHLYGHLAATVDSSSITVARQSFTAAGTTYTYSGSGDMLYNQLSINLTVISAGDTSVCDFSGSK